MDRLHYRTFRTQGGAGQQGPLGPQAYPADPAEPYDDSLMELLWKIHDLLDNLPQRMSLEWRTKFYMEPREIVPFVASNPFTSLAVGAPPTAVVTQLVDERYSGYLSEVAVATAAPGTLSDISWQIRVNGMVHPKFSGVVFETQSLTERIPFKFELVQARTVQLVATNTGAAPVNVTGALFGWSEFLALYKPYGADPASGIG
jgi:hypothetical protein